MRIPVYAGSRIIAFCDAVSIRCFLNAGPLRRYWHEILPARRVQALWESRFPELRRAG